MNNGETCAWLYSTRQPIRLRWRQGIISDLEPVSPTRAGELWVAPALIDLQVNGFAGIDFQSDRLTESGLLQAVAGLGASGCGPFLLTLMTDHWDSMLDRLQRLRTVRSTSAKLRAGIVGWHLEGPFLSSEPGFCGAHDPDRMIDPAPEQIRHIREITETDPVLLTLAPERAGALEAIALAVSLGMKVSLGHTNASADLLRRAVRAGATGFTHLANGCPQQLDRHDNILWRVLETPGLTVSLIPDGIHVSASLFRLLHRIRQDESIYYTTDAVAPAGAPPGRYTVGRHKVDVGPDQIVRQPGKTNYAGSALRPIEGIVRAAEMLARPWQEVWDFLSIQPARLMGWSHSIAVGQPAHLCLVGMVDGRPAVLRTIVNGEESPPQQAAFAEGLAPP